ncbi:MAG: protein phosphatase 2C domain-containing protein [Rhodobacter sp.]|nr:protein phosphatase 2C domain-containing protein [Rhodobacter sp.]
MKTSQTVFERQELRFDVSSALHQGKRPDQEDAIVVDFPIGDGIGIIVLADGMGGHRAGEVASKIVVTEVYAELKLRSGNKQKIRDNICKILRSAAEAANQCLRHHSDINPDTIGMGATLIAAVRIDDTLSWLSIGDSVLYLFRDGAMTRLNEDHSMAPQIDYMVKQGMISEEAGRDHPDRNCLISALNGEEIMMIDCPEESLDLRPGDVILAASDGLMYLDDGSISRTILDGPPTDSAELAQDLLRAIQELDAPDQDNVCFSVVRVQSAKVTTDTVQSSDVRAAILAQPDPAPAEVVHAIEKPKFAAKVSPLLDLFRKPRADRVQ